MFVSFLQARDANPSLPSPIAIETAGAAARPCKADEATFIVAN
jgi:hypothetical protein